MNIGDDLSLELGLRGSRVSGTEGDLRCPSGGVFRDKVFSGQKVNFGRIWSGGSSGWIE